VDSKSKRRDYLDDRREIGLKEQLMIAAGSAPWEDAASTLGLASRKEIASWIAEPCSKEFKTAPAQRLRRPNQSELWGPAWCPPS
jgi:hypothetical protein